jgi:uncharacterized protein YjiS (DUF1127 family)
MTALSSSFAANRRSVLLEEDSRFATPLQPLSRVPSVLELLAELQSEDNGVIWVLALCYDAPVRETVIVEAPKRADAIEADAIEMDGPAANAGIVLDGTYTVIADDHAAPPRRSGFLHRSIAALADAWTTLQREHQIRQSMAMVSRMDDRTLLDLGIGRNEIEYLIRHGRSQG